MIIIQITRPTLKQVDLALLILFILIYLDHTLISTSTPLGNSNFIKASIVFDEEE